MAAKFFTGLPLDGPDPECVKGHGEAALAHERTVPAPSQDHSRPLAERRRPVLVQIGRRPPDTAAESASPPVSACAEHPLAGFNPDQGGR